MLPQQTFDYPTVGECFKYFDQYEMLENIRRHSMQVARVALATYDGLAAKGLNTLERGAVAAGALLHDIAKTICLKDGCRHATVGREICERLGYPEIGNIVQQHIFLVTFNRENYRKGIFSGEELIYYSDKRVRHDQIVSLQERFAYIMDVYGSRAPQSRSFIKKNFDECLLLEKYIFRFLDFEPEEMKQQVQNISFEL